MRSSLFFQEIGCRLQTTQAGVVILAKAEPGKKKAHSNMSGSKQRGVYVHIMNGAGFYGGTLQLSTISKAQKTYLFVCAYF